MNELNRVALALHHMDEGVQAKVTSLKMEMEHQLSDMDQFMVKIVQDGYDKGQTKDVILQEVYKKLQSRQHVKEIDVKKAYDLYGKIKRSDTAITGINTADATQQIANARPHVVEAAKNLAKFRREGNLKYVQSKGLLSEEAAAKWNEWYEHYVSLERSFGKEVSEGKRVFDDLLGVQKPTFLKEQLGSRRTIKNPLLTTIEQTRIAFKRGNENWILKAFDDVVEGDRDSWKGIFEVVDDGGMPSEHLEALADKIAASAKEANITVGRKEAREIAAFMSPTSLNPTSNTVTFFKDGVMKSAKVSDEIARAMKSMSPQDTHWLINLLGMPARGLRTGVTLSADFLGFNLVADTYSAWMKTNYGFKLGLDTGKGLMEAVKDTQFLRRFDRFKEGSAIRQEALAGGVGMGTLSAS
jgi:hypothetical protein